MSIDADQKRYFAIIIFLLSSRSAPAPLSARAASTYRSRIRLCLSSFENDEIRRRAYQLYEERGRENGRELDDWLRAQAEITSKAPKAVSA